MLQKLSSTTAKTTYAGATLKIPAIQYAHKTGVSETDCPVTKTYFVKNTDGTTWASTGARYTDIISTTDNGALTLIPILATFGAGSDTASVTRDIKVVYHN